MKIFWSWQSDIMGDVSRHFIKQCLLKSVEELKSEAIFDERTEIDHDTKNVPGSPAITDTILEKISKCNVFVADVTPVATVAGSGKKIMNPNVAIEMGYAIALKGNNYIVSVMNQAFGSLNDLPFDLRHKRGPIFYKLDNSATKEEKVRQEKALILSFKTSLRNYSAEILENNTPDHQNLDKNGRAIFFELDKPLLRTSERNFGLVKDKRMFFKKPKSYLYIKIESFKKIKLEKTQIKKAMFDGSNFRISPLLSWPDNIPEANQYGFITVKHDRQNKENISDFVQMFENGSIVGISGSFLEHSNNKIYLSNFKNGIERNIKDAVHIMNVFLPEGSDLKIEIGLVNGNDITIIKPCPTGHRYYPEPEIGPLEREEYIIRKNIKSKNVDEVDDVVKGFILSLFSDLGHEFKYEDHVWN